MKTVIRWNIVVIGVLVFGYATSAQEQSTPPPTAKTDSPAAEKEIRAAAQSFVEAFNRGDAKAIAAQWTTDGVYVSEDGERFQGRESIQREYETLFDNYPEARMRLEIDSIRLVSADTAVEEGRAALIPQPPGEERTMSSYTAIHVRQNGQWRMTHVRDTLVELPADVGSLEDLDWLIGSWNSKQKDSEVDVKYRWIENKQFVARAFSTKQSGKVISSGLQIIGLDPSTEMITSWSFTSDGGHAMGVWLPHEKGWMVESEGVLADGTTTYAINILSHVDDNTLSWKSHDRFVDETGLPDLAEVLLKRK